MATSAGGQPNTPERALVQTALDGSAHIVNSLERERSVAVRVINEKQAKLVVADVMALMGALPADGEAGSGLVHFFKGRGILFGRRPGTKVQASTMEKIDGVTSAEDAQSRLIVMRGLRGVTGIGHGYEEARVALSEGINQPEGFMFLGISQSHWRVPSAERGDVKLGSRQYLLEQIKRGIELNQGGQVAESVINPYKSPDRGNTTDYQGPDIERPMGSPRLGIQGQAPWLSGKELNS